MGVLVLALSTRFTYVVCHLVAGLIYENKLLIVSMLNAVTLLAWHLLTYQELLPSARKTLPE
jgi:hypothetical protein